MAISERTGHIAVCVDKYMLVWGGYKETQGQPIDHYLPPEELWVYRTDTTAWQNVTVCGTLLPHHHEELPMGTSGATADFLNGCIYMFGGHNAFGNTNYLLKLDVVKCQWEVVLGDLEMPQPSPRDKLTSWVYRDKLFYFGGYGPSLLGYLRGNGEFVVDETSLYTGLQRGWNNQLLIFDTVENLWSNPKCKGVAPVARAAHAAARIENEVFLFGGRHRDQRLGDLHKLNLDTLTWSKELQPVGDRPCGRSWHTFTKISDKCLFLYGGYTQDKQPLGDAWVLDVDVLQWTRLGLSTERPRLWHTCCVMPEEDILVFGGCSNDILNDTSPTKHCNDILEFRQSPKTLLRLCMDAAFCHRDMCLQGWDSLPLHLQSILRTRLEAWNQKTQLDLQHTGDNSNRGQTCTVS